MCGIFGGFGISEDETLKSIESIKRGEDGITVKKFKNNIFFAARRHLIKKSGIEEINNKKSDQPYISKDGKICLIFNGEFYNFKDYKNHLIEEGTEFTSEGDTEVFLKLFEKSGIKFLNDKKIDSLFSIAIYDQNSEKIIITRDWPGRIPLYYYFDNNRFIFSSELKAFKNINNVSLQEPVELEPGNYLEFDIKNMKIKKQKFFDLKINHIKKDEDIKEIGKMIDKKLDESAKNRTMGDVPICTMLSGGIDSVLTTFYVLSNIDFNKVSYKPTSYVFSVKGFDSTDVKKARIAAEGFSEIGLKLKEIVAPSNEIVNFVPNIIESFEMRKIKALSFYPLPIYWFLAPEMKKDGFKVTIGGHGVDELLGAYDSWKELNKPHEIQTRTLSRLAFINNIYNNMLKRASIIFMNRGPIEARFPFLNHNICELLLSIDKKWLSLNKNNAEILLELIEKKDDGLSIIKELLTEYLDENDVKNLDQQKFADLKKIFWKFPLIVSSFYASERSFLQFKQVFNPKLRGQHGAGITTLENDIINKYKNFGNSDTEIFKNIANQIFA